MVELNVTLFVQIEDWQAALQALVDALGKSDKVSGLSVARDLDTIRLHVTCNVKAEDELTAQDIFGNAVNPLVPKTFVISDWKHSQPVEI